MKKNIFLDLFFTFLKIGLFTFGGGYAMISLIENDCVEDKRWITHDDMVNMTVIAESTPGPIAINCATFVGYHQGGLLGASVATVGVVIPSFVIIYLISLYMNQFLEIDIIHNAFLGIKIGVGVLIGQAGLRMLKKMKKDVLEQTILVCCFVVMMAINVFSLNFSSLNLILISGVISLLIYFLCEKGGHSA